MSKKLSLALATGILALSGCASSSSCLTARLAAPTQGYLPGQPVAVSLNLKNECPKRIAVIDCQQKFPPLGFDFYRQDGTRVPPSLTSDWPGVRRERRSQKLILERGKSVTFDLTASHYGGHKAFHLVAGTYSVVGTYSVSSGTFHDSGLLRDEIWFGKAVTNRLEIVVHGER